MNPVKTRCALLGTVIVLPAALAMAAATPQAVQAFKTACAAKAKAAAQANTMTVKGENGWLFFGPELRHVSVGPFWGTAAEKVSKANNPAHADPLPAILDFKNQLSKAGIELILAPVPPKAVIYPDAVSPQIQAAGVPPRLDPQHQAFYAALRKNGVNVLDLTPAMLENRSGANGPVFCKQDTHWSGKATVLAAQRIAAGVKGKPWAKAAPKRTLASEWKNVQIDGDLRQALGETAPAKETLPLRFVGVKNGGSLTPVPPSKTSPILLLGDSHNLIFHAGGDMQAVGAGLADQLALELGFPVDLVAVRGSGATPARVAMLRQARANPNYLKGKKLVVWVLGAREFTESSGWQKVPVVR